MLTTSISRLNPASAVPRNSNLLCWKAELSHFALIILLLFISPVASVTGRQVWSQEKLTAEPFRTSWDKVFDAVEHVVTWGLEHRVPARIIPEVAEGGEGRGLDAPTVGVERHLGCRPQPHVPIEPGRRRAVRRIAETSLRG